MFWNKEKSNTFQGLYVIYDVIAEMASPIFTSLNDQVAIRSTVQLMIDEGYDVQDFDLRKVGEINHHTLEIKIFKPINIDYHISYFKKLEFIESMKDKKGVKKNET